MKRRQVRDICIVLMAVAGLVCLVSPGIWRAFNGHHPRPYGFEIDQLASALNAYKEKNVEYPPCSADADHLLRRERFMRHLKVAFTNSNYGRAEADYLRLREAVRAENRPRSQPYTFRNASGETALLDLDKLDAAESLVFWLSGLPTPCTPEGSPIAPTKVFGFNRDRDDPFDRHSKDLEGNDAMRFRSEPFFDFRQDRLVDRDDDGWLEYVLSAGNGTAPYVYFDAATYKSSSQDSANFGTVRYPSDERLAERWGVASPYYELFKPDDLQASRWKLPNTFQIISAGRDHRYGPAPAPNVRRLVEFPSGKTWTTTDGKTFQSAKLSDDEEDNLTNMSTATFGETMENSR